MVFLFVCSQKVFTFLWLTYTIETSSTQQHMNNLFSNISVHRSDNGKHETTIYQFYSHYERTIVKITQGLNYQPSGIRSCAMKASIKYPDVLDFTVVLLEELGQVAGVFTRSRSASPAIIIDRNNIKNGKASALVVISKNANAFTPSAYDDATEIINLVGNTLGIDSEDVIISCTGVIGVPLPMDKIRDVISNINKNLQTGLIDAAAEAIMTTDTSPKTASLKVGDVIIAGMAKGAGMLEPNMATMLVYYFTNIKLDDGQLQKILKRVCDSTYNSISIDTDTSTSDSVLIFSTNEIEPTEEYLADFEAALGAISLKLSHDIIFQGEGATKLVEVTVENAQSNIYAKSIGKKIINSPLLKTAIFGADPNWGRIVMAMGKPSDNDEDLFDPNRITISICDINMFEYGQSISLDLELLSHKIKESSFISIKVSLGEGQGRWTVWGCDLSYKYVEINAEYTT